MNGIQSIGERAFLALGERLHTGSLELHLPDGAARTFGSGEPAAVMEVRDPRTYMLLMTRGEVGLGEAYAQGWWDTPDLEALSTLAILNQDVAGRLFGGPLVQRLLFVLSDRLWRRNSVAGAQRNIRAHYDLGNAFYGRWLDATMTYSSAIFAAPGEDLEAAQLRKYDRLLSVTQSAEGPRTLEIGCGWGGFAERAAEAGGREVTAITISPAQHEFATRRLSGRKAEVRLQDYRKVEGQYDSIVSIEMIEAVGERYWPAYFETIKQRLAAGGRAVVQAILVEDHAFPSYRARTDFIRQHTFPGGMLISPSKIRECAARAGLAAGEMFRFGGDYAETLRRWSARFQEVAPELEAEGHAQPFLRAWRFYLDTCAAGFAAGRDIDVAQIELRHA